MQKLIAWVLSIPFLIVFSIIMVTFDLLLRLGLLLSKGFYNCILHGLCRSVLLSLKITGFSWKPLGRENLTNLDQNLPKIIVSNHQSLMDIPMIILACQNLQPKFVAKVELSRFLPFVSIALRTGGHALINRSERNQALRDLRDFVAKAKSKNFSISIFPEGTRARDGQLKPFKTAGLISIMKELNSCEIIPIAINNSWKLARWKMMPVPFGVKVNFQILPAIRYTADQSINESELIQKIHAQISSALSD